MQQTAIRATVNCFGFTGLHMTQLPEILEPLSSTKPLSSYDKWEQHTSTKQTP